jgi:hypothetical protein
MKIKIKKEDIFDFIVGNSHYDPIEKTIDPTRYEVFDCGIYDNTTKKILEQGEDYKYFCFQISHLRKSAPNMERKEIDQLCLELEEIAPTHIILFNEEV